jgi:hypothetical protein
MNKNREGNEGQIIIIIIIWEKKRDKKEKLNTQMFCSKNFGFFLENLNYI